MTAITIVLQLSHSDALVSLASSLRGVAFGCHIFGMTSTSIVLVACILAAIWFDRRHVALWAWFTLIAIGEFLLSIPGIQAFLSEYVL